MKICKSPSADQNPVEMIEGAYNTLHSEIHKTY
jgi:hypothetical protein